MTASLKETVKHLFANTFDGLPQCYVFAPGRVSFMGEHADYCDGFVCPMAIHLGTMVAGRLIPGSTCRVVSSSQDGVKEFKGDYSLVPDGSSSWINYVSGVVYEFIKHFSVSELGFDLAIVSNVPLGGGLSSSASLEVAVSLFLEQILHKPLSPEFRALLCQSAEHNFANMPCGIMDQFTSSCGVRGHLLLLDCRSNHFDLVPLNDPSVSIVVCNSNKKHQLSGSEYPDRVRQCHEALSVLQSRFPDILALRDASLDQVEAVRSQLSETVYRRAVHIVSECHRCLECRTALQARDFAAVGRLLLQSHASLRENFEVSTEELDLLVKIAMEQPGVFGARLTGGGFGGCVVCLVAREEAENVMKTLEREFRIRTGEKCDAFVTKPSQGARVVREEEEASEGEESLESASE